MKLILFWVAVATFSFFTAKLSWEFMELIIDKLKDEENNRDQ